MDEKRVALFESTSVPKAVFSLGFPTVISSLVMVIYNLADTYFVGMLGDPVQNAAVTLVAPVILAFNAVNNLFGIGASSLMSRELGRKDFAAVRKTSAFGFYCALAGGLLLSVFCTIFMSPLLGLLGADSTTAAATRGYMIWTVNFGAVPSILNVVLSYLVRAEGSAVHAGIGTMSGCLLNIALDPLFIMPWGLDMGAEGAGLATFLSNCAACAYFLLLLCLRRKSTYVCISPRQFKPSKSIALGVCAVGIPAAIQNLLNVTGMTVLNNFTSAYAADAVAAMGIVQKINMVPLQVALGASQGIMPLVSYNFSAGNHERMRQVIGFTLKLLFAFMLAVTAVFYLAAAPLTRTFMDSSVIVGYGTKFLRGLCLALPFLCVDFLAVGVFQACGFGRKSLIFAILRKIILEIPALFLLNHLFPLYGIAYAQPAAELILAIAAVVTLAKMFDKEMPEKK